MIPEYAPIPEPQKMYTCYVCEGDVFEDDEVVTKLLGYADGDVHTWSYRHTWHMVPNCNFTDIPVVRYAMTLDDAKEWAEARLGEVERGEADCVGSEDSTFGMQVNNMLDEVLRLMKKD